MMTPDPLPHETPATAEDLAVMRGQLGRDMRGVVSIARRCACGRPAVVRTRPRLEDGTPFPTSLYLTLPSMTAAVSRIEAVGAMAAMSTEIAEDPALGAAHRRAHEQYIARRDELGSVPEIAHVSAGGMPERVKCLHALVGHALAEGTGVNPIGDRVLADLATRGIADIAVCRCEDRPHQDEADDGASA